MSDIQDTPKELSNDLSVPVVWHVITLLGFLYVILGILTYFSEGGDREITHLPAWFRRVVDGIFVFILALYGTVHKTSYPWYGWLNRRKFLWYAVGSIIIHYGGMLPPFYIYDQIPAFNKVVHANASIVVLLFVCYGYGRSIPSKLDYSITMLIGIAWEILEYWTTPDDVNYWQVIDVGYGWYDTVGDIIANVIGLCLIYLYFRWSRRQNSVS